MSGEHFSVIKRVFENQAIVAFVHLLGTRDSDYWADGATSPKDGIDTAEPVQYLFFEVFSPDRDKTEFRYQHFLGFCRCLRKTENVPDC